MATETKNITLDIMQCSDLVVLPRELPYKDTKPGSRLEGKFYKTITCEYGAFTVETESPFFEDQKNDNIYQIVLEKTDRGVTFINYRSITKHKKAVMTRVEIEAYTVDFVKAQMAFNLEDFASVSNTKE